MPIVRRVIPEAQLLKTGQTTVYHVGDDGDHEFGITKRYTVLDADGYSGTVNLDVPHYAAATLAFAATTPGTITDSGNGLATFLTGDVIVIRGSADHDGVYNVSTGGVAGTIRTTEATALEAAGAYISICKRTSHSNNAVRDRQTGKMWARYTSEGEKVGEDSDGKLDWYDAAGSCFTLHAAAADLQMITGDPSTLKIIGGAGEIDRYNVGDILVCSGFASAVNNLPGYVVTVVTVNGADLDISLDPFNNTTVSEAAGGSRGIKLVCRSIFAYCAAANAAELGGYSDWRPPDDVELRGLCDMEAASGVPDTTAFPSWPASPIHSSTTRPSNTAQVMYVDFSYGRVNNIAKTTTYFAALVRGGV